MALDGPPVFTVSVMYSTDNWLLVISHCLLVMGYPRMKGWKREAPCKEGWLPAAQPKEWWLPAAQEPFRIRWNKA